jgi:hypothetical protein
LYDAEQRMVFGANTYRQFVRLLASSTEESDVGDPVNTRMRSVPATVVSTTLEGPLNWPNATVVSGDAVDVVARLKEESQVPLRSNASLSMKTRKTATRERRTHEADDHHAGFRRWSDAGKRRAG